MLSALRRSRRLRPRKSVVKDPSPASVGYSSIFGIVLVVLGGVMGGLAFIRYKKVENGILADVAPTVLSMMGIEIPAEMTGKVLLK